MMGLFDTIIVVLACPVCHEVSERQFQTKSLSCSMDVYSCGDTIDFRGMNLEISHGLIKNLIGNCISEKCKQLQIKRDDNKYSNGTTLYCDVVIHTGRVMHGVNVRLQEDDEK